MITHPTTDQPRNPPEGPCPWCLARYFQADSGRIVRHRLNGGGDRQLNRALHDIVLTRWRMCPRTHVYIAKRRAQGNSDREIRRQLKRYITRELYRTLNMPTGA